MCGIWGIISKQDSGLFAKDVSVAQQMMLMTAIRGIHSTGLAITNRKKPKNKPRTWRTVGGPCFLIQNRVWDDIEKVMFNDGEAVFGHGRYATKGAITAKNAHPFHHKNITLVHNGTIHSGLNYEKTEEHGDIEVDSHALCIKMSNDGIKKALEDVGGAYAVILHNLEDGCIYFGKNQDRPLFAAETADRVLIMSTRETLETVVKQNNYYATTKMCESDKIYKYDPSTKKLTEDMDLKKITSYGYGGYYGGNWGGEYDYRKPWKHRGSEYNYTNDYSDNRRSYSYEKKEIEFIVESVKKVHENEYLYEATSTDGQDVEFRTNSCYTELIGQVGNGEVSYEIIRSTGKVYFVKYRDITWADDVKYKTLNGRSIPKGHWAIIAKTEKCSICSDPIAEEDVAKTVVEENGAVVCKNCVEVYMRKEAVNE